MWRIEGGIFRDNKANRANKTNRPNKANRPNRANICREYQAEKIAHGCKFRKLASMSDFYFKQGKFALRPIIVIGPISPIGLIGLISPIKLHPISLISINPA